MSKKRTYMRATRVFFPLDKPKRLPIEHSTPFKGTHSPYTITVKTAAKGHIQTFSKNWEWSKNNKIKNNKLNVATKANKRWKNLSNWRWWKNRFKATKLYWDLTKQRELPQLLTYAEVNSQFAIPWPEIWEERLLSYHWQLANHSADSAVAIRFRSFGNSFGLASLFML